MRNDVCTCERYTFRKQENPLYLKNTLAILNVVIVNIRSDQGRLHVNKFVLKLEPNRIVANSKFFCIFKLSLGDLFHKSLVIEIFS